MMAGMTPFTLTTLADGGQRATWGRWSRLVTAEAVAHIEPEGRDRLKTAFAHCGAPGMMGAVALFDVCAWIASGVTPEWP